MRLVSHLDGGTSGRWYDQGGNRGDRKHQERCCQIRAEIDRVSARAFRPQAKKLGIEATRSDSCEQLLHMLKKLRKIPAESYAGNKSSNSSCRLLT
jgi:hypothetical protein